MITLRPNQQEPIAKAIDFFKQKNPKPSLIVLPTAWGLCDFFPTKDDKWAHNCRICILNRSDECDKAPCTAEERADGKRGYFSIHQMPTEKNHVGSRVD